MLSVAGVLAVAGCTDAAKLALEERTPEDIDRGWDEFGVWWADEHFQPGAYHPLQIDALCEEFTTWPPDEVLASLRSTLTNMTDPYPITLERVDQVADVAYPRILERCAEREQTGSVDD